MIRRDWGKKRKRAYCGAVQYVLQGAVPPNDDLKDQPESAAISFFTFSQIGSAPKPSDVKVFNKRE